MERRYRYTRRNQIDNSTYRSVQAIYIFSTRTALRPRAKLFSRPLCSSTRSCNNPKNPPERRRLRRKAQTKIDRLYMPTANLAKRLYSWRRGTLRARLCTFSRRFCSLLMMMKNLFFSLLLTWKTSSPTSRWSRESSDTSVCTRSTTI